MSASAASRCPGPTSSRLTSAVRRSGGSRRSPSRASSARPPARIRGGGVEQLAEDERPRWSRRADPPGERVAPHARQRGRPAAPRPALSARRGPRGRRDHAANRCGRLRRGPRGARRADVRNGPGTQAGCAARARRGRRARHVRQPGDHARRLATPPAGAIDVARSGSCTSCRNTGLDVTCRLLAGERPPSCSSSPRTRPTSS